MAKRKRSLKPGKKFVLQTQDRPWIDRANSQIERQDFAGLAQTCRQVLNSTPLSATDRVDALEYLSTAHTMLRQFEEAYQVLSELLEINPHPAHFWYNRAMLGRYTTRLVPAIRDLEKAAALEKDRVQRKKINELLIQTRELAESDRALRGPDFTLAQLEEQQKLFIQAIKYMNQAEWTMAAQTFQRVIAMGECLPQASGNLGLALLMQKQYDAAEAAFKRALEIDPDYDLARQNLKILPHLRQTGQVPDGIATRNPFDDANVSLTFK